MASPLRPSSIRSCSAATCGFLPQTPITSHPVPLAACSHWLQNMDIIYSSFVVGISPDLAFLFLKRFQCFDVWRIPRKVQVIFDVSQVLRERWFEAWQSSTLT